MGEYRVYTLVNQAGRCYIGLSEDVIKRLDDHNSDISKWTARRGPWKLVWTSCGMTLSEARRLEFQMKRQKGGSGLSRLMKEYGSSSGS